MPGSPEDKKESCKTCIEQAKLLVTLASAFLLAPAAIVGLTASDQKFLTIRAAMMPKLIFAETLFIASVLFGYVVLGTVAGAQYDGSYDVYRPATRISSVLQLGLYIAGLSVFVIVIKGFLRN